MIIHRARTISRTERGRALTQAFGYWVAAGKRVHAALEAGTDVDPEDLWTELSFAEALAVQLTAHRWNVVAALLLAGAPWTEVCKDLPMTTDQARDEFGSWVDTRAEFLECGWYLGLSHAEIRTLAKLTDKNGPENQ